jgi:hypothetical protein
MSALDLRTLQRWVAHVVAHPATAAVAVRSRAARALAPLAALRAGHVLVPNTRIAATDQLQIYNGGYLARLVEALQSDYGAVAAVLGEDGFRDLVAAYVQRHPSRHPNLNQLGRHLPGFVRARRSLPDRACLADLATLELAVSRAFDAPEFTPLAAERLAAIAADDWASTTFAANPSLQLVATRHPVDAAFQAWKDSGVCPVPAPQRAWTAVFRRADRVFRQRLERPAFAVLRALVAGEPLARALDRAGGDERVGTWFQGFARDGLFVAVGRTRPTRRADRR